MCCCAWLWASESLSSSTALMPVQVCCRDVVLQCGSALAGRSLPMLLTGDRKGTATLMKSAPQLLLRWSSTGLLEEKASVPQTSDLESRCPVQTAAPGLPKVLSLLPLCRTGGAYAAVSWHCTQLSPCSASCQ